MKTIFKFIKWLVIMVVVLGIALVLGRNFIARKVVETGTKQMTGFPLEIGAVNIGLTKGSLAVRDLKLMNPEGFPEKMFVDLPELTVEYKVGSMIARKPHITDMVLNLNEVVIVKNAAGETNVNKLKSVQSESGDGSKPSTEKEKKPYQIDQIKIHVGTVRYLDYSKGSPSEKKMVLNLDATYKDINQDTDISRLVLATVLSNVGIPDLSGLTQNLTKGLGDVTGVAGQALKGVGDTLDKTTKGVLDIFKKK